jgi:toxin HigB-1
MIRRFRHKGLEALFRTGSTKGLDADLAGKLRRMLARLNDGPLPDAVSLPGYRLHQLKGERKGIWSVRVSGNYRLTFEIEGQDATIITSLQGGCKWRCSTRPIRARSSARIA